MSRIMPQLIRTFATTGLGASDRFVWRIVPEPEYSYVGSPIEGSDEPIDTIVWGIYGTGTMDDQYDQTQSGGEMSPGTEIVHIRPDISMYHGQRSILAGDLFFRYGEHTLEVLSSGMEQYGLIPQEATNIGMTLTYDGATQILQDTDYTYDPLTGKITFVLSIPVTGVIVISYCYHKYIIEDVNNYGKVYIEVVLKKISRT